MITPQMAQKNKLLMGLSVIKLTGYKQTKAIAKSCNMDKLLKFFIHIYLIFITEDAL